MAKLLEKAFAEAARLPEVEQNALAKRLLDELQSEVRWDKSFAESEDVLSRLAAEALEAQQQGKVRRLDPEDL